MSEKEWFMMESKKNPDAVRVTNVSWTDSHNRHRSFFFIMVDDNACKK